MSSDDRRIRTRGALSRRGVVLGLTVMPVLPLLSACTPGTDDGDRQSDSPERPRTTTAAPAGPVVLAADALATSAALFRQAPLVVVAEEAPASVPLAAQLAITWGVPLLVWPTAEYVASTTADPEPGPLDAELARLGAARVVAVGSVPAPAGVETVQAGATPEAIAEATGVTVSALTAAELA
ncbi:hypothetical protein, partial [Rathayibacter sp. Leaf296]|uniref:hypothetical protein n=1 Tax=Rathayibacter sp. Leaf296 TaxID=1736327 RepID=UPI0007024572